MMPTNVDIKESDVPEGVDLVADAGFKARVLQIVAGANIEPTRCRLWITARCATGVRG